MITDLISSMNHIETDTDTINHHQHLYNYEKNTDLSKRVIRRIQSPGTIASIFRAVAKEACLLDHVESVLGSNIRLERVKIHTKPAFCGSAIGWHQDWAYQVYTNDAILTLSVFLDDCTPANAPVYVVPGSHKGDIYPHTNDEGIFSGFVDVVREGLEALKPVPLLGKVGDISLHHYRILHYSPENASNLSRRLLLLRYAAADAWPLMGSLDFRGGFSLDAMKARIVRGDQTLSPRLKDVPVRMPFPYPESFSPA
jgi:ectoine hydroxylase-related dioxygenase (phytanoyl-CoA dioxygenase family)